MSETLEDDEMIVILVEDEDNLDIKQGNSDIEQQNQYSTTKIESVGNLWSTIFNLPIKKENKKSSTEYQEVISQLENYEDTDEYETEYLEDIPEFKTECNDNGDDLTEKGDDIEDAFDDSDDVDYNVQTDTNPRKINVRNKMSNETNKEYKTQQNKQVQIKIPRRAVQERVLQTNPAADCVSYVAQLRKENPEMAKDRELLIEHLISIMKNIKPPDPPDDFCKGFCIDGENIKFECSFCEREFDKKPVAARHYQTSHGEAYLTCYACGNTYTNNLNLYRHEKRCRAPDAGVVLRARARFLLAQCHGRSYFGKRSESKPQKRFFCSQCPASFQDPNSLQAHENRHTGDRPFRCKLCTMAYPSYHGLQRHSKLHGECRYTCDHCGRGFHHRSSLESHLDSHRAVRRYPCQHCERRFVQKSSLTHHMNKVHLNLPPEHGCHVCPKRFARLFDVKKHMAKAHGLAMITRKMFFKALPGMTDEEVAHAKKFFDVEEKAVETTEKIIPDSTKDTFDTDNDDKDNVRRVVKQIQADKKTNIIDRNCVPKSRVPYIEFPIKTDKAQTKQDKTKTETTETVNTKTKAKSKIIKTKNDIKTETNVKSEAKVNAESNLKTKRNSQTKTNLKIKKNLNTKRNVKNKVKWKPKINLNPKINLKPRTDLNFEIKPQEKLITSPKKQQIKEPRPIRNKRPPQRDGVPKSPVKIDEEIEGNLCHIEYKRRKKTVNTSQENQTKEEMYKIVRDIKSTISDKKKIINKKKPTQGFYELKREFLNELKNEIEIPEPKDKKTGSRVAEKKKVDLVPGTEIPECIATWAKKDDDDATKDEKWKLYKDASEKNMAIADFIEYMKSEMVLKRVPILRRGKPTD